MPAPLGNQNARKENRIWRDTLIRAAKQKGAKGVEKLRLAADALVDRATAGDVRACVEIGDRIDGKVPQAITGPDGGPVQIQDVPWVKGRGLARR